MSDSNSIINLGDVSKPATVLIEKISDAVGGIFKPYQITRVAKAEAEASLIQTQSQIQITDLQRRALSRFVEEEAQKQANIESIASKALPLVEDDADPESVEDDWIINFFDKCRIVSDSDMQQIWSRILAEEANEPGTFSRRTVNLISDLDKRDAELFTNLCRYNWTIENEFTDVYPLVFDFQHEVYAQYDINFSTLIHLDTLGLIQFDGVDGFLYAELPKRVELAYYCSRVELDFSMDADNALDTGSVLLTRAGQELASICKSEPIPEYLEYARKRWIDQKLITEEATE